MEYLHFLLLFLILWPDFMFSIAKKTFKNHNTNYLALILIFLVHISSLLFKFYLVILLST